MAVKSACNVGSRFPHRLRAVPFLVASLMVAATAEAQPFKAWASFTGYPTSGFVEIPHHPSLDPSNALTVEAWVQIQAVAVTDPECWSIAGKDWTTAWWVGACNGNKLRSYVKGQSSSVDGGTIRANVWTHIAVTSDGVRRKHYIDGELVADVPENPGPLGSSPDPVRIGSDVAWAFTPRGSIDEVRLWSVARTAAQIRGTINQRVTTAQPGLVAVWALDGNPNDVIGTRDGAVKGSGVTYFVFSVDAHCTSNTTRLCLHDRFSIHAWYRTGAPGTAVGLARRVPFANAGSGLFWFFSPNNWEIMIKAIDACSLNSRHWIFSAATTNVFYRVEVMDLHAGLQKIYFNYPGPPAPAVTDTSAFATCP